MSDTTEVKCVNPRCGEMVTLMKPTIEVMRGRYVTVVVFAQGDLQRCGNCGQPYTAVLKEIPNMNFLWRPVAAQADPVILERPNQPIPPITG